jgi:putative aldouronate transport system permease protein
VFGGILIDLLSPTEGIINKLITGFGFEKVFFLGDPDWFRGTLVFTDLWKTFGFSTVIYLAAITSIDPTLYEVASIDGAGRFRKMWSITIPGMSMVVILMTVLHLGNVLNAGFEQVFVLYSPLVYPTGDIIDTFVYRLGLLQAQYSVATAVGLFKGVVSFVLISVSYYIAYRFFSYRLF